ncbi:serine protease [Microbacterium sp. F2E]|nr:serine protease [Microbacterium sp. F2E]
MIEAHGQNATPIGTGFLVGSGRYLVTAKHVVDAANGQALRAGLAGVDYQDDDVELRAAFIHAPLTLLAQDPANDLALLEVDMPPDATSVEFAMTDVDTGKVYTSGRTAPVTFSGIRVTDGMEIAVSGFPLAAPALVTTRGIIASTFAPQNPADPKSVVDFLCDITAISGNSGGPVYRVTDGSVVGLVKAVKLANVGAGNYSVPLAVVTPSKHIVELLDSTGVPHGGLAEIKPPPKPRTKRR